jgi:ABC-type sugar transport system ATPase subunit
VPDHPGLQGAHVELRDIGKSFGAARALEAVSLQIARGSIHALVGENGAGKSTLGKIVSGVIPPDHGEMLLGGEPVRFHSPREAIARGIVLIAQELSLVPALSVAENVLLGTELAGPASCAGPRCGAVMPSSPGRWASSSTVTLPPAAC